MSNSRLQSVIKSASILIFTGFLPLLASRQLLCTNWRWAVEGVKQGQSSLNQENFIHFLLEFCQHTHTHADMLSVSLFVTVGTKAQRGTADQSRGSVGLFLSHPSTPVSQCTCQSAGVGGVR